MQILPLNRHYVDWFSHLLPSYLVSQLKKGESYVGIGVIMDDTACGVLCVDVTEDLVELEFLYVPETFRRRGVGTAMVNSMAKRCSALVLPLMGYFSVADFSDELYLFFAEQNGFSLAPDLEGEKCYGVPVSSVDQVAKRPSLISGDSTPFFALPTPARQRFYRTATEEGFPFVANCEENRGSYVGEICQCFVDDKGVSSAIFYQRRGEKNLCLSFLYCRPGCTKQLSNLLSTTAQWMLQSPYQDGMLELIPMSDSAQRLFDKLFPQRKVLSSVYMICQDLDAWEVE